MQNINDPELIPNDNEFINNNNVNVNENNDNDINDRPENIYNPASFQTEILIKYLQDIGIIKKLVLCDKCNNMCQFVKDKQFIVGYVWRCRGVGGNNDVKINLRKNSCLENLHINIKTLYFLIFHCFSEGKSVNETLIEHKQFAIKIGVPNVTLNSICKVFNNLRKQIKINTHLKWKKTFLGEEIGATGYPSIEIDESKIIGNSNTVYWMFGLICRTTREARIFCVLNNRTKQNLLPIIEENVTTNMNEDNNLAEFYSTKTRIYSDSFASYQVMDFKRLGYILKRVNHSVWFGYGLFHTNTVESLWSQIKYYANHFTGLSIENLNKEFNSDETLIKEYLDGWITYALLLREFKRKRLSWIQRIHLLGNYLFYNHD